MHIHFIAVGGAAMHSLAIALHNKGYAVTGSDDEIFEPSRSRLERAGLLPPQYGWFPERITKQLDAVILGMHARKDNPELKKALELGIKVYSFPEFLFHQTQNKLRVVIAGSHGKTTITSMVMHVLKHHRYRFDYMAGSRLEGFDNMVYLDDKSTLAVFEGDEYLSSCLDPQPKFLVYKPQLVLISGIAWDHFNVFPTWESYVEQFRLLAGSIPSDGCLVYCEEDRALQKMVDMIKRDATAVPYSAHQYQVNDGATCLLHNEQKTKVQVFGRHNMQNIAGAKLICGQLGITDDQFYEAISGFTGSARRLELLAKSQSSLVFTDFAHSPSKVQATIKAVREQYPQKQLLACLELHTYSSLNKEFLRHYHHTMSDADQAVVYFDPETVRHKRLESLSVEEVKQAFDSENLLVINNKTELENYLLSKQWTSSCLLFMSSGSFSGLNLKELSEKILGENI